METFDFRMPFVETEAILPLVWQYIIETESAPSRTEHGSNISSML
jgi:hypothetical protein